MLTPSDTANYVSHVCLQIFDLKNERHPKLRVPQLTLTERTAVISYAVRADTD